MVRENSKFETPTAPRPPSQGNGAEINAPSRPGEDLADRAFLGAAQTTTISTVRTSGHIARQVERGLTGRHILNLTITRAIERVASGEHGGRHQSALRRRIGRFDRRASECCSRWPGAHRAARRRYWLLPPCGCARLSTTPKTSRSGRETYAYVAGRGVPQTLRVSVPEKVGMRRCGRETYA